jgi:hypothetical protein
VPARSGADALVEPPERFVQAVRVTDVLIAQDQGSRQSAQAPCGLGMVLEAIDGVECLAEEADGLVQPGQLPEARLQRRGQAHQAARAVEVSLRRHVQCPAMAGDGLIENGDVPALAVADAQGDTQIGMEDRQRLAGPRHRLPVLAKQVPHPALDLEGGYPLLAMLNV